MYPEVEYLECSPANALKPYIKKLWFCSSPFYQTSVLNVPFVNHELVFNLSESHEICPTIHRSDHIRQPVAWLSGLQQTAYQTRSQGHHEMIGVTFEAGGLSVLTQESTRHFTDQFIDAVLVLGSEIQGVLDQLNAARTVEDKFDCINNFLSQKILARPAKIPAYLDYAIQAMMMEDYTGNGKIRLLAQACGVTNKSLVQAFTHYLGLSPLKFQHLVLVTRGLQSLAANPQQKLTQLALQLGFFDQAHFIRVFKKITSFTPSHYARIRRSDYTNGEAAHYIIQQG